MKMPKALEAIADAAIAEEVAHARNTFPDYVDGVLNLKPFVRDAAREGLWRSMPYAGRYEVLLGTDFALDAPQACAMRFNVVVRRQGVVNALGSLEADTHEELRIKLNALHLENVGYKPDEDQWQPLGELLDFVMGWYIENDIAAEED